MDPPACSAGQRGSRKATDTSQREGKRRKKRPRPRPEGADEEIFIIFFIKKTWIRFFGPWFVNPQNP
jgi:hypothetical protein